ncbi:Aste57867_4011 [Aphanomyces stellatus]|uniref:Aste57867_4011 protein n=1 Tax=Aphanomyces stellatus TaxID=120398 RepID=A0A485KC13_9STRA|nr:hypothetical protein As57867_004000 [Aphanomyces stellatus]VFT81146.1 Aste57867_4011 [Aphanomyces stellatus]
MGFKIKSVTAIFALLCVINMLNYIDRGIIPGAPVQFQAFIQEHHGVDRSHVSVYIGILVSAFIASYSIFICVFGYLSMTRKPFQLSAIGLFIWVFAIVLCGLAKPLKSFALLLVGRLLSGIGESSFQATTPPFIDEFAPPASRTVWLGIFYCGISVGTAVGYTYGAAMAAIWDVSFYILAVLMFPLAYACWQWIPLEFDYPLATAPAPCSTDLRHSWITSTSKAAAAALPNESIDMLSSPTTSPSFVSQVVSIIRDPVFLTATFGVAAFTFTLAGMGAFAPAILIGYGILSDSTASMGFGAIAVLAGLVGSPLGGWLIDRQCRGRDDDEAFRSYIAARQMLTCMTLGVVVAFVSLAFMDSSLVFLACLLVALTLMFTTQSATTLLVLYSVPKSKRGFAMGLNTLLLHLFGDVPSPIVLGALKDAWAPHCGSVWNAQGEEKLDPACNQDKTGLRNVLMFAYGWLSLAVLCWAVAFAVTRHRLQKQQRQDETMGEAHGYMEG